MDTMRVRAFPFGGEVEDFIADHETIILIEQNRDAQMKALLVNELNINPREIQSVLYYGGVSITASFINDAIIEVCTENNLPRMRRDLYS